MDYLHFPNVVQNEQIIGKKFVRNFWGVLNLEQISKRNRYYKFNLVIWDLLIGVIILVAADEFFNLKSTFTELNRIYPLYYQALTFFLVSTIIVGFIFYIIRLVYHIDEIVFYDDHLEFKTSRGEYQSSLDQIKIIEGWGSAFFQDYKLKYQQNTYYLRTSRKLTVFLNKMPQTKKLSLRTILNYEIVIPIILTILFLALIYFLKRFS